MDEEQRDTMNALEKAQWRVQEIEREHLDAEMAELKFNANAEEWHGAMLTAQRLVSRFACLWAMQQFKAGGDAYRPFMRGME